MEDGKIYITIDHIEDFGGYDQIFVGDTLILKKDRENRYDDEAVAVFGSDMFKLGYVANSVDTVARGTYSAGRLYEHIGDKSECTIMFKLQEQAIA